MPNQSRIQVAEGHYRTGEYDSFNRWASYWYQLDCLRRLSPSSVLEIGVGTGLLAWYAHQRLGLECKTVDLDPELHPDYVGDITDLASVVGAQSFDLVVAFQVLEHLPFDQLEPCLRQMSLVARDRVVISLPYSGVHLGARLRLGRFIASFGTTIPCFQKMKFEEDGQHHWEIGARGYPLRRVRRVIRNVFTIERGYMVPENSYHYMFELRRRS